ncbi:hypothetical protein ACWGK6_25350 [Streptomyces violaceusniger]|uniref:hypothetical protein n=1 Tax=Streptomyces violaceusniger TaxID=68280 RepID=UPI0037F54FDB
MDDDAERLPAWVTWRRRPFPDANTLLLHGRQPALVDSGFVGHAEETAAWARARRGDIALVVNTLPQTSSGGAPSTPTTSAATPSSRPTVPHGSWTAHPRHSPPS